MAIKDYAQANDLDSEDYEDFVYLIRQMDSANLKWNQDHKDDKAAPAKKA